MLNLLRITLACTALIVLTACQKDPTVLTLRAVLSESGQDVSDQVDWFVEWDGSWLGPDMAVTSEVGPGRYTARLDILGAEPAEAEIELAEGESGEIMLELDASLVEVAVTGADQQERIAFDYQSSFSMGSAGIRLSEDGVARSLVSRDLSELVVKIGERVVPVQADFGSGAVLRPLE